MRWTDKMYNHKYIVLMDLKEQNCKPILHLLSVNIHILNLTVKFNYINIYMKQALAVIL